MKRVTKFSKITLVQVTSYINEVFHVLFKFGSLSNSDLKLYVYVQDRKFGFPLLCSPVCYQCVGTFV